MTGLAEPGLAQACLSAIERQPIDRRDLSAAATLIVDAISCMAGAARDAAAAPVLAWSQRHPPGALRSAWTLGALSNLLELDSMHVRSSVHAGTVIVPAALAVACEVGATAPQIARAVLRGTEAAVRLGASTGKRHRQIMQSTSTCGGFGAALACADLYGLDGQQALDAMCNMVSTAGGLWSFVDEECGGKQWHAGHASACAVLCAQLASTGLRGPRHVIDGPRGFHAVLCEGASPQELTSAGAGWAVHQMAYKPWPSPRPTHAAISAALLAHPESAIDAVRSVEVRTFSFAVELCDRSRIETAHDARFSLQFLVAAALLDGRIDFETFSPAGIARIRPLASRVHVIADPAMSAAYPAQSQAAVAVALESAAPVVVSVPAAVGDPELPLSEAQWEAKLGMLFGPQGQAGAALREELDRAPAGSATPMRALLQPLFSVCGLEI